MADTSIPPRERLRLLLARANVSGTQMAKTLEYASAAGFLRFMQEKQQGDRPIPYEVIKRLTPHLRGAGNPPITLEEILACSDVKEIPRPVAKAFSAVVDDGDGLLAVRYRVESGVYTRADTVRSLGASRIGVAKDYPAAAQFVAVLGEKIDGVGDGGTQLHCVQEAAFDPNRLRGQTVIVGHPYVDDLIEVTVAVVEAVEPTLRLSRVGSFEMVDGDILGVIIGTYRRK